MNAAAMTWPRRYPVPVTLVVAGFAVWWAWQREPRPIRPEHAALVAVALTVMIASWGVAFSGAWSRHPARVDALLIVCMAASIALIWLARSTNGPGSIGAFAVAFIASRRGRFGIAVAIVTGVAYVAAAAVEQLGLANIVINAVAYTAAYGFATMGYRARLGQVERIASDERQRLAREIHDVLAHNLSALTVQLEATRLLAEQRPGDPEVAKAIDRAHRVARDGLLEAKRAVGALRGDALPGPELLEDLVREFEAGGDVTCRLEVTGRPVPLSPEARLAIYRAAQEGLTNVRKHAHASKVTIRLQYRRGGAELTVEDVEPSPARTSGAGYGLSGMRERAELIGGTLDAGPTADGFRLRLWVPA